MSLVSINVKPDTLLCVLRCMIGFLGFGVTGEFAPKYCSMHAFRQKIKNKKVIKLINTRDKL